jgi:hypothetical protein
VNASCPPLGGYGSKGHRNLSHARLEVKRLPGDLRMATRGILKMPPSMPPNGLELCCPAAEANHNSRADHGAGKAPQPFRPPAGSASASCWAELGVRWSLAETCVAL